MAGGLALQAGASLQSIAATATSLRLHASPPTTYVNATGSTLGIKSFVANSGFFMLAGSVLSVPQFSGAVTGSGGTVAWFSIVNDSLSQLLAVGPLPAPAVLAATESNWLLALQVTQNLDAPTLTSS
jgi:hypothetical protein